MNKIRDHLKGVLAATNALTLGALLCTPALAADETPAAPAAGESVRLEEVVVTAEKRETTASKTAISMNVLNSQEIQEQGVRDLTSLSQVDPTLQFSQSSSDATILTIRGVSSRDTTEIGDPAVPVGIDGFFMDRTYAVGEATYDLQRVEVLRGPQGTLYGRNAIGGVVNFITNEPTRDYDANVSVTYGNYNTIDTTGAINLPLSDTAQMRVSFGTYSHSGYVDSPQTDTKFDDEDSKSARVSFKFEPFDGFTALIYGQFLTWNGNGPGYEEIPFAYNAAGTDISHDTPAGINRYIATYNLSPFKNDLQSDRLHWDFKYTNLPFGMSLNYLGGFDNSRLNNSAAYDNLANNTAATFDGIEHPLTQNHELRLASGTDQAITWQGGLFYFNEKNHLSSDYNIAVPGFSQLQDALGFPYPHVDSDSYAAFGQANWKATDTLAFSAGVRETHDDKSRDGDEQILPPLVGETGTTPVQTVNEGGTGRWSRTTWHAGLNYTPTVSTLVYVKADSGYKAGGFNSTGLGASTPYGPETAINYEFGIKQSLFDNMVRYTADAFWEDYKGYQASLGTCPTCNTTVSGIVNAGAARIYGLESSVEALLGPIGKLNLSVNYLQAYFTQFAGTLQTYTPTGGGTTIPFDFVGKDLIQSPRLTMAAGLEHSWALPNSALLTGRVQTTFHTAQFFTNYNWADSEQHSYTLSDAYLQYTSPDSKWTLQGWVHNLENTTYYTNVQESGTISGYIYAFGAPRTFGITLTANFK
jgi:iron complex outermembrane receptor protein